MLTYADAIMYTGVPSVFDAVAPACPPPQVAAGCLNGGSAYAHACGAIRTRRRGAGVRRVREKKREKRVGTKRFGVAARRARKRVPTAKGTQLHTSAYVSIRQYTSAAYVSIRLETRKRVETAKGTQFTCFTGAKVQILTDKALGVWCRTHADACFRIVTYCDIC